MDQLQIAAKDIGKSIPVGLQHLLMHHGGCRKDVYKYMYGQLVYGGGKAKPGTTLIYPREVRQAVRERFPETDAGSYDDQYNSETSGTHLTLVDMMDFQWRSPPGTCTACKGKCTSVKSSS